MNQAFDRRKTLGCIADPPNAFAWPMHMLCGASPLPLPQDLSILQIFEK